MEPSDLTSRTEARRVAALAALDGERQAELGQFFTPGVAADLIAGLPRLPDSGHLRVLDPGAGVGSLTAALVARAITEAPASSVEIVAVEIDPIAVAVLRETLDDAVAVAEAAGVKVRTRLIQDDFIHSMAGPLATEQSLAAPFDLVIMNPPYRKLAAGSVHRKMVARMGVECPNLYAAFLAMGVSALKVGGQLVAITPRSFANGPYFGRFRRFLLDRVALDRLHTFESRSSIFSDGGVLQENVVFSATRGGGNRTVVLSVSRDHTDAATLRSVDYRDVVRPGDAEQFIRIAAEDEDTAAADAVLGLPCSTDELGLTVSTGKVVDFRARDYLRVDVRSGDLPLVYPGNVRDGVIEWPASIRKPQAFVPADDVARKLLLPTGCYVVVKRFSSKEERRRVVAAVWDPNLNGVTPVAFENHLNVFHVNGSGLDRDFASGLSLWLNSSIVEKFFRTFSGHTQVNATDLRSLRFPTRAALTELGAGQPLTLPEQEKIDALVRPLIEPASS